MRLELFTSFSFVMFDLCRAEYEYTPRVRVFQEAEETPDGPGAAAQSSSGQQASM